MEVHSEYSSKVPLTRMENCLLLHLQKTQQHAYQEVLQTDNPPFICVLDLRWLDQFQVKSPNKGGHMPISVHYCQVQYSDFSSQMPLAPKTESAYIISRQKYQGSVGCFINGSLVLFIHLYSCETLEFKILMFTTRLASNLFLFKLRELMLK